MLCFSLKSYIKCNFVLFSEEKNMPPGNSFCDRWSRKNKIWEHTWSQSDRMFTYRADVGGWWWRRQRARTRGRDRTSGAQYCSEEHTQPGGSSHGHHHQTKRIGNREIQLWQETETYCRYVAHGDYWEGSPHWILKGGPWEVAQNLERFQGFRHLRLIALPLVQTLERHHWGSSRWV